MQRLPVVVCALSLASCAHANGSSPLPAGAPESFASRTHSAAAVFKHLFSFDGTDGKEPYASLISRDGTLYGTTYGGGAADSGTAFRIAASGMQRVLHSFEGGSDGVLPAAPLLDVNGALYGTTVNGGGSSDEGVVFKIATSGAESVLHRFAAGTDGANPYAGLTGVNGLLYGTTAGGGDSSQGTVFTITTSGKERAIYSFGRQAGDGTTPVARLTNVDGVLYGTTSYGGAHCGSSGCGAVFKITTSGQESVLYSFKGGKDGSMPAAALTDVDGALYGTTMLGGSENAGTVFKITTSGSERLLYSFKGGADGALPQGLVLVNGRLYGTTSSGGSNDDGTVFSVTASGSESVLYRFRGGTNGAVPQAGLLNVDGTLYGTTATGGASNAGTVFSIKP